MLSLSAFVIEAHTAVIVVRMAADMAVGTGTVAPSSDSNAPQLEATGRSYNYCTFHLACNSE